MSFISLILFSAYTCKSQSNTDSEACTYLDATHHHGDAWVDDVACSVCECTRHGVQCNADVEGSTCVYNSKLYYTYYVLCITFIKFFPARISL